MSTTTEIDFIEELRLRRWARENYVAQVHREDNWHPVVHQEMERKDQEATSSSSLLVSSPR